MQLAVAAIIGAGLSIFGSIQQGQEKAAAAQQDAALKNAQADELVSREKVNEGLIQQQSFEAQLDYGSAAAATGGEGTAIGGIMQIKKNTAITLANGQRDANFKAQMLRSGANIATNLATDEVNSSYITGAGTALTGATKAYDYFQGPSSTPAQLPKTQDMT